MKFLPGNIIKIDKELSELDKFLIRFIRVLKKHSSYVVVSGYVSILLGRSRASEDIDVITEILDFGEFVSLFENLKSNSFYCLNGDYIKELYSQIAEGIPLRFAEKNTAIPNIELKFAKNKVEQLALDKTIKVILKKEEIIICNLELQIVFKERVLKSQKDIEDARHIRNIAGKYLDKSLIKSYGGMINEIYR